MKTLLSGVRPPSEALAWKNKTKQEQKQNKTKQKTKHNKTKTKQKNLHSVIFLLNTNKFKSRYQFMQ